MPQYRKLYTKSVESFDIADMPDDFTRLMWVFLPLKSCSQGRGINHPSWLKSQLFPLRSDVTLEQVENAMRWYTERGMTKLYRVDNRPYYVIENWAKYQGNTTKEAKSPYPEPNEENLVRSKSRASQELVPKESVTDAIFNIQYSDADADADAALLETTVSPPATFASFVMLWGNCFPGKPQPRLDNKTLQGKMKTRMKQAHFSENWEKALKRASESDFLNSGSFFKAGWFLKNDDNYEKCLDGNYDNSTKANGRFQQVPTPVEERVGGAY